MQGDRCIGYRLMAILTVLVLWACTMQGIHCCQENPSLYFIDDHSIRCLAINSLNQPNPSVDKVVSNIANGAAIDIDVRNKIVFWSDTHAWTINRMNLTSGEVKIILREDIGEIYSLAVEWESGLIYWTDYVYERIEVANADGSSRRTLVTQNVKSPIGIAVDPANGYMVWSDYDYAEPKIMRADLTGENQRVLVRSRLFFGVPLYLVIDYSESRVYWTDLHYAFTLVRSVDLNGQNFRLVKYLHHSYFPFDLAIFQNQLYWVDESMDGIARFPFKNSGVNSVTVVDGLSPHNLEGVIVSDPSRQPRAPGSQPCAVNNGNCSDLCLLTPGRGRKCACPQGVALSADGMTCKNESTAATQSPPLPAVHVNLVGSVVKRQGRVEVLYNGQWGTICDDYWGLSEAHVICRMLNYSGAELAPRRAFFGPGTWNSPIWLDSVKCRGDESTIAACRHDGWRQHDCYHSEDASVVCWSESTPAYEEPTLAPGPHPELKVRLQGGDTQYEGRVEIYLNQTWGTICDDSWGIEEANVICRMMNFTEGALSTQCCGFYNSYGVPEQIWLDDVHCVGDEQSIAACRHSGWGRHNCRHREDVGVVCKHSPLSTPDQVVRLVDGARESEGRVEIFRDGHWGTVCDDHWDTHDADVVCRMLNYSRALRAPRQAFFGRGNGKIWLSNVHCVGNETSILQCAHQDWGVNNCDHHEDASVICERDTANLESKNFLLACEAGRSLIYHVSLDAGLPVKGVPLALETHKPQDIAFHYKEGKAYWTEQSGSLVRAHLNGSSREVIVTGLSSPTGIAVDFIGQNLYFADRNGIKVSKLDGSYQTPLITSISVHGITLDGKAGYIYFTTTGITPRIMRADMDGRNQVVLANLSSISGTTLDIALDKDSKRMYFSDQNNNLVKYFNLSSLMSLSVLSDRPHGPIGIALFNGTLYWTGGGSQTFGGAIYKADANNFDGSNVFKVMDLLSFPKGLSAHDSAANEMLADHPCAKGNGGCAQLCLINPGGHSCLCPNEITGPCQKIPTSTLSTTSMSISLSSTENQILPSISSSPSFNLASLTSFGVPSTFTNVDLPSESPLSAHTAEISSVLGTGSSSISSSFSSSSSSTMPSANTKASSSLSKVKSSPSQLATTTPLSSASMSSSVHTTPNFCSVHELCQNGGSCQEDGPSYKCLCIGYFVGRHCSIDISSEVVVIVINIPINQFNKTALIFLIVEHLNSLCKDESDSCPIPQSQGATRRRRALRMATFKPEDVIVTEPKQVDENVRAELAVVFNIMSDGSPAVVSSGDLSHIILELSPNISHSLGGRLISVGPKFPVSPMSTQYRRTSTTITTFQTTIPPTMPQISTSIKTSTSQTIATTGSASLAPGGPGKTAASKAGSNSGVIGGATVSVLVIAVVIGLAIWYFRVRGTIPYKRNTDVPKTHTTAFENPGYDNVGGFGMADDGLYNDIPPVVLSPYEDISEFGAVSNPVYSAIDVVSLPSVDGKREGSDRSSSNILFGRHRKVPWEESKKEGNAIGDDAENRISIVSVANMKIKEEPFGSRGAMVEQHKDSETHLEGGIRKELPLVLHLEDREEFGKDSEM